MAMRKRKGIMRAARAARRKTALLQRRRGTKNVARNRRNETDERAADKRLVDAFGGIDIAIGRSWFGPRGRK